jgi:hypothetical protein
VGLGEMVRGVGRGGDSRNGDDHEYGEGKGVITGNTNVS